MKSILLTIFLSILSFYNIFPQNNPEKLELKNTFKGGIGYFTDIVSLYPGKTIWIEGSRMLKTGFNITAKTAYATTNMIMGENWGTYEGMNKPEIYFMTAISFNKPFKIKNHTLEPGIGFIYRRLHEFSPRITIQQVNSDLFITTSFSYKTDDIGLDLSLDYYYTFQNNFLLGLRLSSYNIPGLGFEGSTFSSILGVKF